jgi:hypothetical protein
MLLCGKTTEHPRTTEMLPAQEPHDPSCQKHSPEEHDKAVQAVADLLARGVALGDAKHDGGEN